MSVFHDDLELDEALDEIDPLRHLMHQSDDDDDEPKALIPKQLHSVQGETLQLSFSGPQHLVEIALAVDASPGCGGIAWPAGEVLSSYLTKRGPDFVHGRSILELGSGTGLVGLVAAKLQLQRTKPTSTASVWITDQAPLLGIMHRNVQLNDLNSTVVVAELNWGTPLPPSLPTPDLILAADCVYFEPAFPLLVQTLCDLVDAGTGDAKETEVLFCYKRRRKADKRFFGMLRKAFTWDEVTDDPDKIAYNREAITLLRLSRRKPSSLQSRIQN
ncbi:hypothetical protein J132_11186 [Termitomyces sp. J132]|nr:hypothetical protein H2248_006011 [Termitomyces sp. 'cryptogamus']KNZ79190.1 hypothetical protein J132_11186 [Termitomyces sp. J132]